MKKINPHIYSVVVDNKKRYFGKTTNATKNNAAIITKNLLTTFSLKKFKQSIKIGIKITT